ASLYLYYHDAPAELHSFPTRRSSDLHNFYPKFYGGLTNNFKFRQFDLGTLFSFQYGNYNLNLQRFFLERNPGTGGNKTLLDRWQKPGDITDVPRLTNKGYNYTLDQDRKSTRLNSSH